MSAKEVKKEKITKEELKDRLMKSRALSDDELEKVAGGSELEDILWGISVPGQCSECGAGLQGNYDTIWGFYFDIMCSNPTCRSRW